MRVRQKSLAFLFVLGRTIGANQRQRLLALESMALDRLAYAGLFVDFKGAQRMSERNAHGAFVDSTGNVVRELLGKSQAR